MHMYVGFDPMCVCVMGFLCMSEDEKMRRTILCYFVCVCVLCFYYQKEIITFKTVSFLIYCVGEFSKCLSYWVTR